MPAEGMDVTIADLAPVLEPDAELEGRRHAAHELLLVDAEQLMKDADRRHGRFADADGADVIGLRPG